MFLIIPEEKDGVNQGFISARGTNWSIIGKITINNKIIITRAEVGLRKIELARNVMHISVVVTKNEKRSETTISIGISSYL